MEKWRRDSNPTEPFACSNGIEHAFHRFPIDPLSHSLLYWFVSKFWISFILLIADEDKNIFFNTTEKSSIKRISRFAWEQKKLNLHSLAVSLVWWNLFIFFYISFSLFFLSNALKSLPFLFKWQNQCRRGLLWTHHYKLVCEHIAVLSPSVFQPQNVLRSLVFFPLFPKCCVCRPPISWNGD